MGKKELSELESLNENEGFGRGVPKALKTLKLSTKATKEKGLSKASSPRLWHVASVRVFKMTLVT